MNNTKIIEISRQLVEINNPANLDAATIAANEEQGIITDLETGNTFQELIDWHIFTQMWLESMQRMHKPRGVHKLAAIMRNVERLSGIAHDRIYYIRLARMVLNEVRS